MAHARLIRRACIRLYYFVVTYIRLFMFFYSAVASCAAVVNCWQNSSAVYVPSASDGSSLLRSELATDDGITSRIHGAYTVSSVVSAARSANTCVSPCCATNSSLY